ncbi:hypothetical protein V6N13_109792 [Hibiscus sabdariffa]
MQGETSISGAGIIERSPTCSLVIPMEGHNSLCVAATDVAGIATFVSLTTTLPNLSGPPSIVDLVIIECHAEEDIYVIAVTEIVACFEGTITPSTLPLLATLTDRGSFSSSTQVVFVLLSVALALQVEVAEKVKATTYATVAFMIEGMDRAQDDVILGFQSAHGPFSVTDVNFNALCEVTTYFFLRNPFGASWELFVAKYRDTTTNVHHELRMFPSPDNQNGRENATVGNRILIEW